MENENTHYDLKIDPVLRPIIAEELDEYKLLRYKGSNCYDIIHYKR